MPHRLMQTTKEFVTILESNAMIVQLDKGESYMFLPFWFKIHLKFMEYDNGKFEERYVWEVFSLDSEIPKELQDSINKIRNNDSTK